MSSPAAFLQRDLDGVVGGRIDLELLGQIGAAADLLLEPDVHEVLEQPVDRLVAGGVVMDLGDREAALAALQGRRLARLGEHDGRDLVDGEIGQELLAALEAVAARDAVGVDPDRGGEQRRPPAPRA